MRHGQTIFMEAYIHPPPNETYIIHTKLTKNHWIR